MRNLNYFFTRPDFIRQLDKAFAAWKNLSSTQTWFVFNDPKSPEYIHRDLLESDECSYFEDDQKAFTRKVTGELPETDREIMHLRHWDKLTTELISKTLRLSVNTILNRERNCEKFLKKRYQKEFVQYRTDRNLKRFEEETLRKFAQHLFKKAREDKTKTQGGSKWKIY